MLQDIIAHIPFFTALIAGGLLGRFIFDNKIKLPTAFYVAVGVAFVISLVGAGYCIEHGPRVLMLAFNAFTAFCLPFALTCGGDFAEPKQQRISC